MPILIRSKASSQIIHSKSFSTEQELELLLIDAPELLRISGSSDIAFVDRQVRLEAGNLDLLFVTREGVPLAVEVKLARNGESRRQVVAQAIDYLSSLTALTVEELDSLVNGNLRKTLERFTVGDREFDLDEAWKATGTNLRAGQARLVVVLDESNPDLERIFHFLARNSQLDVQLFTVQHYSSPTGDEVYVPRILVNPDSEDDGNARNSSIPTKTLEELLLSCSNPAVIKFFGERSSQIPFPRTNSKGNEFVYPPTGAIRWYVAVRSGDARVNQIGRFLNDKDLWTDLSAPDFSEVNGGGKNNLNFSLVSPEDFRFFQSQMERPTSNFAWQKTI